MYLERIEYYKAEDQILQQRVYAIEHAKQLKYGVSFSFIGDHLHIGREE